MANHATTTMPWAPEPELLELWMGVALKAAFNGVFTAEHSAAPLFYGDDPMLSFTLGEKHQGNSLYLWRPKANVIELRRDTEGFVGLARDFLMECSGRAFGASVFNDDGAGPAPTRAPATLDYANLLRVHAWLPRATQPGKEEQARKQVEEMVYFNDKALIQAVGTPKTLPWASKVDWSRALSEFWGSPTPPSAKAAHCALLPCCAYDLPIPAPLLDKVSAAGAQRALGVALMWKSSGAARELATRFGKELDFKLAQDWASKKLATAHRHNSSPERLAEALEGIPELTQALILNASVRRPKKSKAPRARSL